MRPADLAAAFAAIFVSTAILAVAAAGISGAATPVPPGDPPAAVAPENAPSAVAPAAPSHEVRDPEHGALQLRMGRKRLYIYAPAVPADPAARAVLYFSGDWGWRPLQQETAAYLAGRGRHVVGIDASEYFSRRLEPADWAADLVTLTSYVNEKAGKPPGTPVLLIGFTFGGELIPYMLNRGGSRGFAGALLISPDQEGAIIYRTSIQLKLPSPPDEVFGVAEEIKRLPRSFPVFLMDGALDPESALKSLVDLVRGPKRFATIDGADRSFRKGRDAYFVQVAKALAWLETAHDAPGQ